MSKTAIVYAEEALLHDTGERHPESSLRLQAIHEACKEKGIKVELLRPDPASIEDLARNHTLDHIETVKRCCLENLFYPDPDTIMMPASWDAALLAAGAGITAAKAILDGQINNAFITMRPPGHHAEADRSMGFCLFNNVAITARWLREEGNVRRVAIFDFDVHHGNGTQNSFYDDETVLFISIHEYPHYPGTGFPYEHGKNNTTINFQMPPGCSPEQWITTIKGSVVPQLERFAPDFLLLSAGFDAHRLDPLGNQLLEAHHFAEITRLIKHIAHGKIISFLEGGYHLGALGESAVAHVEALME